MIKMFTKLLLLVTLMTETVTVNARSRSLRISQKKRSLGKKADLVAHIAPYPGTSGGTASGTVSVHFDKDDIVMYMDVEGVPECSTTETATNGCGIHIHAGISCNTAAAVEGHFWSTAKFEADPWADIRYDADASGKTTYSVIMIDGNGYDKDINFGRAFVIHNPAGGRIGCGLLEHA
mmetsp:Transcript_10293/g.14546  ORF Transcript_10293/g.14546 Transcript_10293/m.14546 type:complete len:178 (-) Transcript_10293:138-671(-)